MFDLGMQLIKFALGFWNVFLEQPYKFALAALVQSDLSRFMLQNKCFEKEFY